MNFYILDKKEELITIIDDGEVGNGIVFSAKIDEKLESYELLNITIKADSEEASLIEEEYYIVFKDVSGWREYTIYEIEDEDGDVFLTTIKAELSSSELIDEVVKENLAGVSKDPEIVLEGALKDTRWSVGNVDESIYNSSFNVNTSYMSTLEAIHEIAKSFSCEVRFSYQVDGNKVVKRFVDLYKQFGEDKGKRFEVDKDINSIKRTVNTENIKTAIIPFSKEITETDEETGIEETYQLDISGVEWKVANGDPVDKPLGQNWIGDPTALQNWGRLNADGTKRHRFMTMEFDLEKETSIASMAWVQLGRYTKPTATYEVQAVDLFTQSNGNPDYNHEKTSLGDVVVAIDNYFAKPIMVQTRVVEMERNLLNPKENKYVFGSSKAIFSVNTVVEEAVEEVAKNLETVLQNMGNVQKNLNGKNRVFRGSATPINMFENDIWFRPHPSVSGENQMLVYNGLGWEIKADTSELQDASRLQFGTIDGAEINVINLTADNITGGNLSLANGLKLTNGNRVILGVNNSTGEVELNVSSLTVNASPVLTQDDLNEIELKDGKSAYEIAVEHGFKGTEAEWVQSLKGEDGENGIAGEKGEDGKTSYLHVAYANFVDDKIEGTNLVRAGSVELNKDLSTTTSYNHANGNYAVLISRQLVDKTKTYILRRPIDVGTIEIFLYPSSGKPTVIKNLGRGTEFIIDMSEFKADFVKMAFRDSSNQTTVGYHFAEYFPIRDFSTTISSWRSFVGVYTDTVKEDSLNPEDYSWSIFKGASGDDGRGVLTAVTTYALHTNGETAPTSGWSSTMPAPEQGKYQWTRTVTIYTDDTTSTTHNVSYLATDGQNGTNGAEGNGVSVHLVSYGLSESGSIAPTSGWTTVIPEPIKGQYLWTKTSIRYTDGKLVETFSTSYYAKDGQKGERGEQGLRGLQGDTGEQGIKGSDGIDGKSSYTHIAYANSADGSLGFSTSDSNREYIGMYTDHEEPDSEDYTKYNWTLIKGADGNNGIQGAKGEDGLTPYLHIAYANSENGLSGFSTTDSLNKLYIGQYTDFIERDSLNPVDYHWTLIKGEKGDRGEAGERGLQGLQGADGSQGIQGEKGSDGRDSYTHIAYSTGVEGQSFNHETFTQATHIGMYVSHNQNSSGNWRDYKWTLIKGRDGSQGIAGVDGVDGLTPYFHTAWANNESGTSGFSTTVSTNKLFIGTYTDYELTDSNDPEKYNWVKIKGEKGDTGATGATGEQGPRGEAGTSVNSITEYYLASNLATGVTTSTVGWKTTMQPITSTNKYLWNYEKINFSDGKSQDTIPVIMGVYGDKGADGKDGVDGVNGRSITGITEYYLASASETGITRSTNGWTTAMQQTTSTKRYLWNYEKISWSSGTTTTYIEPIIIGVHGVDGSAGKDGVDGTGIQSVSVTYQNHSSGTSKPTGSWLETPNPVKGTYLWTRTITVFTDGEEVATYSVSYSATDGQKGDKGADGSDGTGVQSTEVRYNQSTSGTVTPTTTWATTPPTPIQGQYNWTRTIINYTDGTKSTAYSTSYNATDGQKGDKGDAGADGKDGKGIKLTTVSYQSHTNGTTEPTGTWTTSPTPVKGRYLWTRTVTTYTDNSTITTFAVSYNATDGQNGVDGKGIQSTTIHYQLSPNGSGTPPSTWTTGIPAPIKGQYLWTRTVVEYTDGTVSTSYSTSYYATDGQKGDKGDTGAKGDNAPIVKLSGATQIIQVNESGVITPSSSFTVAGVAVNTTIGFWQYSVNGGSFTTTLPTGVSRSGNTVTISPTTSNFKTLSIQASDGVISDTFTIARTVDGTNGTNGTNGLDAITVVLTNESHTFAGGTANAVAGSTTTDILAYKGTTRIPVTIGTISGAPSGMSTSISNNGTTSAKITITVTTSMSSRSGLLTIPMTINGQSITKTLSYSLALQGIKGDKGDVGNTGAQGIQGLKGIDGVTTYTWIKYADSPTSGMNDSPSNKAYIGIAYNKTTPTKSTVYSDYQWSLIKGANGSNGTDGKTTYTWIKYAETEYGGNMSDSPDGKRYLGIAYNKETSNESSNPADYSWSPLYDNVIPGSVNLFRNSGKKITKTSYLVNSYYMNEKMVAGQVYTLTLKADIATSQTQLAFYLNGGTINLGVATRLTGTNLYSLTFVGKSSTATNDFVNVYNVPSNTSTATIHWAVLTKGNVGETDWVPATTDIVSPDNIVSAINLSAEEIKISGDKIILDGHTEVDGSFKVNGDVIADGTLSADKIVGGRLSTKYLEIVDDKGNVVMEFNSTTKSVKFNVEYMEIASTYGTTIIEKGSTKSASRVYKWTKFAYSPTDDILYDIDLKNEIMGDRTWVGYANKPTPDATNNFRDYNWEPSYYWLYDGNGNLKAFEGNYNHPRIPSKARYDEVTHNYPAYWAGFDTRRN